jgi:hypothetical protein
MKKYNLAYFSGKNWAFVLTKNNKILYRSKKQGLRPLVFCLKYKKDQLKNAIVFDKIIGRAAALLMIHGQVKSAMTPVISRSALAEFRKEKIETEYGNTTEKIINRKGDDICPMEKLSKGKNARQFAEIMINNLSIK